MIKAALAATMVIEIIMNKRSMIEKEYREGGRTAIAFWVLKLL
jgi:hypothetical protein